MEKEIQLDNVKMDDGSTVVTRILTAEGEFITKKEHERLLEQSRQDTLNEVLEKVEELIWYIDQQDDYCSQVDTHFSRDLYKDESPLVRVEDLEQLITDMKGEQDGRN